VEYCDLMNPPVGGLSDGNVQILLDCIAQWHFLWIPAYAGMTVYHTGARDSAINRVDIPCLSIKWGMSTQ